MNLLFIGDVVGYEGSTFLSKKLYTIKKNFNIDITIVNGENSAAGNGITKESSNFLFNNGVDVITTGNHAFKRLEMAEHFDNSPYILRPANYPYNCVGNGYIPLDMGYYSIVVINLMGVVYMQPLDNPFTVIDSILENITTPNIFLDFHAEATAEKKCMGHYLSGRVTAVLGTHTHVQTADSSILKNHTAYITDVGMTGAENSVLGVNTQDAIEKLRTHFPVKFRESTEPCFINGVVVEFNEQTGRASAINPIIIR